MVYVQKKKAQQPKLKKRVLFQIGYKMPMVLVVVNVNRDMLKMPMVLVQKRKLVRSQNVFQMPMVLVVANVNLGMNYNLMELVKLKKKQLQNLQQIQITRFT